MPHNSKISSPPSEQISDNQYQDLGSFGDLVQAARQSSELFPVAEPGRKIQALIRETLSFKPGPAEPVDLSIDQKWVDRGIEGTALSWSVGYGPKTEGWLLRPEGVREDLPGILALHGHGGFKYYGKEKIAEGYNKTPESLISYREHGYEGRAYANDLALEGFSVFVPDTFLFGSRKFEYFDIPEKERILGEAIEDNLRADTRNSTVAADVLMYNAAAIQHEHVVEKYAVTLGTTLSGIIAYEDRVALNVLRTLEGTDTSRLGCIGLSGGGARASFLQALEEDISASVIIGMMSTYEGVLDKHVSGLTWMYYLPNWTKNGDWPDIAAARAPSPLLVQYNSEDELFSLQGMKDADLRLKMHYGEENPNYQGRFYPGEHKFDRTMQLDAFAWLKSQMGTVTISRNFSDKSSIHPYAKKT